VHSGDTHESIIIALLSGNIDNIKIVVDYEESLLTEICVALALLTRPALKM
jgi:hypothetical protein